MSDTLDEDPEERRKLVAQAHDTHQCPFDGAEMDCKSMHERDSSNDRYFCPKCGWEYSEMETWGLNR